MHRLKPIIWKTRSNEAATSFSSLFMCVQIVSFLFFFSFFFQSPIHFLTYVVSTTAKFGFLCFYFDSFLKWCGLTLLRLLKEKRLWALKILLFFSLNHVSVWEFQPQFSKISTNSLYFITHIVVCLFVCRLFVLPNWFTFIQ